MARHFANSGWQVVLGTRSNCLRQCIRPMWHVLTGWSSTPPGSHLLPWHMQEHDATLVPLRETRGRRKRELWASTIRLSTPQFTSVASSLIHALAVTCGRPHSCFIQPRVVVWVGRFSFARTYVQLPFLCHLQQSLFRCCAPLFCVWRIQRPYTGETPRVTTRTAMEVNHAPCTA